MVGVGDAFRDDRIKRLKKERGKLHGRSGEKDDMRRGGREDFSLR